MNLISNTSHGEYLEGGESRMLPYLIDYLRKVGWAREGSLMVQEFPVNGRRVDLALLTRSGKSSAFELKESGFARALEQAAYNRHSFDRSWVVVPAKPLSRNLDSARTFGLGVLIVSDDGNVKVATRPSESVADPTMRMRARSRMYGIGGDHV
mgnify:CR=1 FL=1